MSATINEWNGDLTIVDRLDRKANFHWSRFHGLIIDANGPVYVTQETGDRDAFAKWLGQFMRIDE